MHKKRLLVVFALVHVCVWTQLVRTQNQSGVSVAYRPPGRVSVGEPMVVDLTLQNHLDVPVSVDLGRNDVGNLQLRLRRPGGDVSTVDPRQLRRGYSAEQGFTNRRIAVRPGEPRTVHILLNEWFPDIQDDGTYELTIDFIGDVRTKDEHAVEVPRRATMTFTVAPADAAALRQTCERLVRIVRTTRDAPEARFAAKALSFVRDPIAIPYLERVIERGKVLEIASVDTMAIRALEGMGTTESHAALIRARLKATPAAQTELEDAVERTIKGVK